MSVRVRPMQESDLARVLAWRNHPDVRKFMYTQHEITPTEHQQWFESSQANAERTLLIYESEYEPLGFINFTEIEPKQIANWGFYLSSSAPRGTGFQLGTAALAFAFDTLGLHKVCGQALAFNERSIRLHGRLGFRREAQGSDQHVDGHAYHDIIHFGLLRTEWQAQR